MENLFKEGSKIITKSRVIEGPEQVQAAIFEVIQKGYSEGCKDMLKFNINIAIAGGLITAGIIVLKKIKKQMKQCK